MNIIIGNQSYPLSELHVLDTLQGTDLLYVIRQDTDGNWVSYAIKGTAFNQGGGGGIQSIQAGTNITIDNTDPNNPIVSATIPGGTVVSVVGTAGQIVVDSTNPASPVVSLDSAVLSALALAATALQPGALADYVTLNTVQTITAQKTFSTSGNSATLVVSHGSGSGEAITVTKGGNGAAVAIAKTSGSGPALDVTAGGTRMQSLNLQSIAALTTAASLYLVSDGGDIKSRTPAQVLADIGAYAASNPAGFVTSAGAAAAAPVQSVTGTAVTGTPSNPVVDNPIEQVVLGTSGENLTASGAISVSLSANADTFLRLTGNTTITFTDTPASGFSVVRSFTIVSTSNETLGIANSTAEFGTYEADGTENEVTVKATNFPTEGLKIKVFFEQPN